MILRLKGVFFALLVANNVQAMDILDAWRATRTYDPSYRAALMEHEAGSQNRALGLAGLLPQASLSGSKSKVNGEITQPNFLGHMSTSPLKYDSYSYTAQLRQPLFNWTRWAEYRQGNARANYSDTMLQVREQEIAIRLAERFFDVLLSRDTIALNSSRLRAIQHQLDSAERRFQLGDGTVTEIDEAQSRRDLARAELIETEDQYQIARRALQEMIGQIPPPLADLKSEFSMPSLEPADHEEWLRRALEKNPEILSQQHNVHIAKLDVERTLGNNLPSVDFVASHGLGESDTLSTRNQRSTTNTVGIQVTIPLFSGGSQLASYRQNAANSERALSELDATRERIAYNLERYYRGVVNGAQRIRALELTVTSSARSLESMKKGVQAGTRTTLDVLNAEDQLYQAQRNLLESRLRYLLSRLQLDAITGGLDDAAFERINNYLVE